MRNLWYYLLLIGLLAERSKCYDEALNCYKLSLAYINTLTLNTATTAMSTSTTSEAIPDQSSSISSNNSSPTHIVNTTASLQPVSEHQSNPLPFLPASSTPALVQHEYQSNLLSSTSTPTLTPPDDALFSDIKGDNLLRIAIIYKDLNQYNDSISILNQILNTNNNTTVYSIIIQANALCIYGLIYEQMADFPSAEVRFRSALELVPSHIIALERLGRVYIRYSETIPAAVQCFIKVCSFRCISLHVYVLHSIIL